MRSGNFQGGFTYLLLLVWLSITALLLLKSRDHIAVHHRRLQEAQLLFAGDQIRAAINSYRNTNDPRKNHPPERHHSCFPVNFQQLIFDKRGINPKFHLRRIYFDSLTQTENWLKIYDPNGRWIGVRSAAKGVPLKKKGFSQQDKTFEKAKDYRDWAFKVKEDPAAPLPDQCQSN